MAKDKIKEAEDAEDESEVGPEDGGGKKGFVKNLLGNRKMLLIAAGATVLVLGGIGTGAYLFFSGSSGAAARDQAAQADHAAPIVPPQVAFYDMPDMVVNIQSPDGSPAYLKLSMALELKNADQEAGLKLLMPRVVDQFQSYLRELRIDDLRGSEGVLRLKEELLRRINLAAKPYHVHDVLLKEMIVQ